MSENDASIEESVDATNEDVVKPGTCAIRIFWHSSARGDDPPHACFEPANAVWNEIIIDLSLYISRLMISFFTTYEYTPYPTVKPEPEQEGKGADSEEVVEKDGKMNGGENGKDGATDEDTANEDNGKNGEATSDGDQKDDDPKPDPVKEEPADKGDTEDNPTEEETAKGTGDTETAKTEEKEEEKEKQEEKKKPVKPKPFKVQYIHDVYERLRF